MGLEHVRAPAPGFIRRVLRPLLSCHAAGHPTLPTLAAASAVVVAAFAAPHRREESSVELPGGVDSACQSSQRVAGGDAQTSDASVCGERAASSSGLSGGSLAALVVLLCVGAAALACLVRMLLRRRRAAREHAAAPLAAESPRGSRASSDSTAPEAADAAAVEPSSPRSSDPDSAKPLRSALRRTSAVLAKAREEAAAAAAAKATAGVRPSLDSGVMSPYDLWQEQQGLAGRSLSFTLFPSSDDDDTAAAQVVLQAELGRGRYGEVLAASWSRRGAVVVKALTAPGSRLVAADVARVAALRHPNLLRVLGFAAAPEAPMLLLQRSARGSLAALLRADADADTASRLGWPRRAALAAGVASGLAFLHAQRPPIAHGDCKPENVLLDADLTPRLSDAGLLASRPEGAFAAGTPLYAPPEAAEGPAPPAEPLAADVYAFGSAILHALAHAGVASAESFASPLYRAVYAAFEAAPAPEGAGADDGVATALRWDNLQVQFARSQAGWLPEVSPGCPAAMAAAIASCCTAAPAARPTAEAMRVQTAAWAANAHEW